MGGGEGRGRRPGGGGGSTAVHLGKRLLVLVVARVRSVAPLAPRLAAIVPVVRNGSAAAVRRIPCWRRRSHRCCRIPRLCLERAVRPCAVRPYAVRPSVIRRPNPPAGSGGRTIRPAPALVPALTPPHPFRLALGKQSPGAACGQEWVRLRARKVIIARGGALRRVRSVRDAARVHGRVGVGAGAPLAPRPLPLSGSLRLGAGRVICARLETTAFPVLPMGRWCSRTVISVVIARRS